MSSKYDGLESHFDDARLQSRTEVNSARHPAVAGASGAREDFIYNTSDRLAFTFETCLFVDCGNCYIHHVSKNGRAYCVL